MSTSTGGNYFPWGDVRGEGPKPEGKSDMVLVPRAVLERYAKSGVNHYHGFSERCCPVCGWDGLYAEPKDKDRKHKDSCWLGRALQQ